MLIGLIVNPIAGMGGRVGLKGTDGEDIIAEAKARGAKSWSPERAQETLTSLSDFRDKIKWLTWSGEMGESLLASKGDR